MASVHTRGQKPSPFGLALICLDSGTEAEYQKQLGPKALTTLVMGAHDDPIDDGNAAA